jgi:hypothetical protein
LTTFYLKSYVLKIDGSGVGGDGLNDLLSFQGMPSAASLNRETAHILNKGKSNEAK